jgi:hypothetical protein
MVKVLREGTARIECPANKCHLAMDELSVMRLIGSEDGKKLFTKVLKQKQKEQRII